MSAKRYLFYISQNYSYAILRPLQEVILARGDHAAWFLEGKEVDDSYLLANENQLKSISAVQEYHADVVFIPGNVVPDFISGIKVGVFLPFIKLAEQHQHFSVKQTGWPALDPLFDVSKVNKNTKPTILMCSTFSRALTCAPHLFETVKRLSAQGKWQWLIQFHPKMPRDVIEQYKSLESENLSFIETDNVVPLLQQADVMVCDTSSVLMMFLMLNKPVVTFNNISPKDYMVNISEEDKLEESIEYALSYPAELKSKVEYFINDTHPYVDGKSAQRVLAAADELLAGENVARKRKPFNLLRRLKMRKKLNYWKL